MQKSPAEEKRRPRRKKYGHRHFHAPPRLQARGAYQRKMLLQHVVDSYLLNGIRMRPEILRVVIHSHYPV